MFCKAQQHFTILESEIFLLTLVFSYMVWKWHFPTSYWGSSTKQMNSFKAEDHSTDFLEVTTSFQKITENYWNFLKKKEEKNPHTRITLSFHLTLKPAQRAVSKITLCDFFVAFQRADMDSSSQTGKQTTPKTLEMNLFDCHQEFKQNYHNWRTPEFWKISTSHET